MLENSEQDLNSRYRETQDSETEDQSRTNRSASEQNLFVLFNLFSESESGNSGID